jgi:PAS domain S-box-containing protein
MTLDSTLDRDEKTAAQRAGLALSDEDIFSLLGTLADGIIVMDADGVVRFFSDEAARMFGYTSQEIVGEKLNRLIFDEDVPLHEAGLARHRHGGTARRGVVRVRGRRKDGFEIPLEITIGQATVRG